jgi:ABC-type nitrate/sulfonate/bicarbonate transport system ATPase subunit
MQKTIKGFKIGYNGRAMETPMIQLEQVSYAYPDGATIFLDYSWQVRCGEAWAVLGPSGCGKSTLLYLLAGLRFPTSGRILVDGQMVTRPRPRTGLILQEYGLLPWATVRQNAALGINIRGFYGPDGKHAPFERLEKLDVSPWLERLGLLGLADQYPGQISGGQRQRTAIARTLMLKPDLLLMDEPFSSLDAPTRDSLQNLTQELKVEQGLTLVVVTHAIEEAALLGEKILLLSQPPNQQTFVFENPGAGKPGYHNSQAYFEMCHNLRQSLDRMQER